MRGIRNLKIWLVMLSFLPGMVSSASAEIKNVPGDFLTIQAAIDDCNDGDVVIVAPGTYTGNGNRDIDFLGKAITVCSIDPNDPNIIATTVIDCEQLGQGFYFHSQEDMNSILDGFSIINGSTGIYCYNYSSPQINNCYITDNSNTDCDSCWGGGIMCYKCSCPTITKCLISNNSVNGLGYGGGICCHTSSNPTIVDCFITYNSSSHYGGGLVCFGSNPSIKNCIIHMNHAGINGGGIYCFSSEPTFIDCIITSNLAQRGGGISNSYNGPMSPNIINCIIKGNIATHYGGGIFSSVSNPIIRNCLITANLGGGIAFGTGEPKVINCTIVSNKNYGISFRDSRGSQTVSSSILRNNIGQQIEGYHYNASINFCNIQDGFSGIGNVDVDPLFVLPGYWDANGTPEDANDDFWVNGDYHLLSDSPCINAGDPNFIAGPNETDIDGEPRIMNGRIDMGVDEYHIIYVDVNAPGANDGSSWENAYNFLQDALSDANSSIKPVEIRVAQDIYRPDEDTLHPDGTGSRYAAFRLINGVTLKGGYAGFGEPDPDARDIALYETTLSGDIGTLSDKSDNCYHIFYHPEGLNLDATAILDGFTVAGGNANGDYPDYYGGGIYNLFSSPTVTNCTFSGNSASQYGGGMYNRYSSSPTVTNCTFSNNSAHHGGGMCSWYSSSPTVKDCTFSSNWAEYWGGGMFNHHNSSPTVRVCTFRTNSAGQDGGGMYNYNESSPTVEGCTFTTNSADSGGGMCNYVESSPRVENCIFTANLASDGSGMYNTNYSSPTVNGCTFNDNSATEGRGGGIYNFFSSNPTITSCAFSGNSASVGGGMCNYVESSPRVENCIFSANSAKEYGGGMYNEYYSSPTLTNCTFSGNSAIGEYATGGGMHNYRDSSPTVEDCNFNDNSATEGGGMCNNDNSSPALTNCTFSGNSAEYGGGMLNEESSPMVEGCTFSSNLAEYLGGGMYNRRYSSPTVKGCTFSANSTNSGGGMCNGGFSSPTVINCTFTANLTYHSGGGMSNWYYSSPTVTNCTFTANHGDGMYNEDYSSPTVTNCTFTANRYGMCNYGESSPRVTNCILWADVGPEIYGGLPIVTYSDVQVYKPWPIWPGKGNINADPLFADANNGDYHLLPDSPCINTGDPNFIAEPNETDIDGELRIMLGRVDMGADEFNPFEVTFDVINKRRIDRTVFAYDCNVTLTNISPFGVRNVQLEIVKASNNMVIIDPNVTFGDVEIGPGQSASSINACSFQVDRSQAIEPAEIIWWSRCELVDSGQTMQHSGSSAILLEKDNIAGDITGDGKVDFEDLAEIVGQWLQVPGVPSADIAPQGGDGIVNFLDFAKLAQYWTVEK